MKNMGGGGGSLLRPSYDMYLEKVAMSAKIARSRARHAVRSSAFPSHHEPISKTESTNADCIVTILRSSDPCILA